MMAAEKKYHVEQSTIKYFPNIVEDIKEKTIKVMNSKGYKFIKYIFENNTLTCYFE